MTQNQASDNTKHPKSSNKRPTIGFLNASGIQFFHHAWRGVADVAREHNVNAINFVGEYVRDTKGFKSQANVLYDLIDAQCLDGLVIQNLMCNLLAPDEVRQFYEHYRPLPIVSLGRLSMEGYSYVQSGGYAGMRKAIVHLIEVHNRRRIAFIKGLPNYRPHDERYQAYIDVLVEYDLPFDPARVAAPHDAAEMERSDWGQVALRRLLDDQKAKFDALATTNDRLVYELLPELQVRGIRAPDDVALVSFDNEEGSHCVTPPLTTVPIPIYEMGRRAAETLLAKMADQKAPDQVIDVPSDRLIVRQSCGCLDSKVAQVLAGSEAKTAATEPLEAGLAERRESIVAEMTQAAGNSAAELARGWAERLLDRFVAALTTARDEEAPARFLSTLDDVLRQVIAIEGDIEAWTQVLFTMRRQLLPYLGIDQDGMVSRDLVEGLWLQAQAMIGEVAQRVQAYRELQTERRRRILDETGAALATNFDVNELADTLAQELPRLGISRGYLALYESPQPYRYPQPAPEWSRLVLAYDEKNPTGASRIELEPGGRRFPSRQLAPEGILPQQGQYNLVARALYFQNEQIGFMLLDGDQQMGSVYDILCAQVSSALQGALLVQRVQKHAAEVTRQKYILDMFMGSIPDSIYFKDRESRFTRINQALVRHFELDNPAEGIGKSDYDFFPEELAQAKYEQEQEIVRTGRPILNLMEPDGVGQWALTTKMPLLDENGEVIGTFGISRDITELKRAQYEVELANREIHTLNEQLKEENLRMSAELDVTRRIQEMILPSPEELQQIAGLDIVGYMQPAAEVGGDYYDVLHRNGVTHIGIGDVTGHGLESGVLMLMTQTAIRTLIDHGESDPLKFITTINRTLFNNVRRTGMDKSLTLALVNLKNGRLKLVGQHEEMLLVRADGQVERLDTLDLGLPLALEEEIEHWVNQTVVELGPGEGIVLYTDGITEAVNDRDELYGLQRLCEVISQNWRTSAKEIKQAVVEDVTRHIGQQTIYDDLTLVVLKQP